MRTLHELDLNREYFSSKGRFFGREDEQRRLVSILSNEEGCTILIAGDRGSGKTSLIREAIRRSSKLKAKKRRRRLFYIASLWSWTKVGIRVLDIPLLATDTPQEKSREAVLRMIVHTLVIDYKAGNLYQKIRLPVSYFLRLRQLERTLKYSKVTQKSNHALDLTRSSGKFTLGMAREYEMDLTYADIELQLREFFKAFSKHVDFYIIFDELDKFEAREEVVEPKGAELKKPHEFIRELKNLFTTSNAKFILTSTENYYQEISEVEQDIRLSALDYKYSIFTHKILISHFNPASYEEYFDYLFKFEQLHNVQHKPYEILKHKLMWITDLYPLATKKKLFEVSQSRDDGSMYVDLESIETSLLIQGENVDSMMYVLLKTYSDYASDNDFFYNRILYKSLKCLAVFLLGHKKVSLKKSNAFALIFDDVIFLDLNQRERFFSTEYPQRSSPLLDKNSEDWKLQLMRRDSIFKKSINKASISFLAYLDLAGLIQVSQSPLDSGSVDIISILDNVTLGQARVMTLSPLEDINRMEKGLDQRLRYFVQKVSNAQIDIRLPEILQKRQELKSAGGLSLGWNFSSLLTAEEGMLAVEEIKFNNRLASNVFRELNSALSEFVDSGRRKNEYIFQYKDMRLQVLVRPRIEGIEYTSARKDISKVVCIDSRIKSRPKKLKNVAYFRFRGNMSDYSTVLQQVVLYIKKELGTEKR